MASRPDLIAGRAFVLIEAIDKTRVVLARAQQYMTQWANKIQSVGTITLKVSIAAALPLGYAIKEFAEFENRMSRISILMDEPNKHMDAATKKIREWATEFGKSTSEIQEGFTVMVSGGMDPAQLLGKDEFEAVLQTAIATRSEIRNVAEGARRMAMAYGLTIRAATDFMLAVDVGGVDFNEMAGGLGRAAGMAQMAGISWQEFGAMIGAISMVLPTDEVITAMNNMSAKVFPGGASKDAIKVAAEFGINLEEMVLQGRTFMDLLKQIWLMPGKSEAQVNKALAELFPDIRGRKGLSQLILNPANYYRMLKLVTQSQGRTSKAWDLVKDDTLVNLGKAWQGIHNIALEIGGKLKPATSAAATAIVNLSQKVATFVEDNQRAVIGVTAATAGFIALGASLVTAGLSIRLLSFALTPILSVLWLLYSPFAMLRTILMATIGVVAQFVGVMSGLLGIFTAMNSVQLLGVILLFTLLYGKLMQNKDAISQLSKSYSQWLASNLSAQLGGFLGWFDQMSAKAIALGDTFKLTFMGLTDAIMAGDLQAAWDITLKGLELSWLQLIDMFKGTWDGFVAYFRDVFSTLESLRQEAVVDLGTQMAKKGGFWSWLFSAGVGENPDEWAGGGGVGEAEQLTADLKQLRKTREKLIEIGRGQEGTKRFMTIMNLMALDSTIAQKDVKLKNIGGAKLPGPTDEQWEQTRQQMLKHGITEPTESAFDKKLAEINTAFDQAIADATGAGAQNPEVFRKANARAQEIAKQRQDLEELREKLAKQRVDAEEKAKGKYSGTGQTLKGELIDAFTNPATLDTFFPGLSEAADMLSGILGIASRSLTGPAGEEIKGGIPATQTVMKNTAEAGEFFKQMWQEQHMPQGAAGKEQEESSVRQKLLEVLPQINDWLRQIAGAEPV